VRIALVHDLPPGGALRTLAAHLPHFGGDLAEVCLATATPVTADARVVAYEPRAPRLPAALRPVLRHTDLGALVLAWRRAAAVVDGLGADVVLAHPCQFLGAPPALAITRRPSVYFCHEPRRIDYEQALRGTRNAVTRIPYAGLHAAERRLDRRATAAATRIVTNSRYTAGRIAAAYGRTAAPIPMGVGEAFTPGDASARGHVLSVGTLIPSKGHDIVIRAAARAAARPPVVVVAPRADDAERSRLASLAGELGVRLDIRVAITDDALLDLYRGAFATVQMAVAEPLGLASMEAQACGSPVVVAAEGGLPETIDPGASGWAVPRDPVAVAERLDALADPAVRDRVSSAAAAWGAGLRWERSAAALRDVLREAAGRP
jgi:glycosyltransferase involved in cell wall biosynthesis